MKTIVLLCAQGMSSSAMVNRMKKEAQKQGFECVVNAYAVERAKEVYPGADIIMLGPQVGYERDDVKEQCPGVPVEVIDMASYGRLDGAKVIAQVRSILGC